MNPNIQTKPHLLYFCPACELILDEYSFDGGTQFHCTECKYAENVTHKDGTTAPPPTGGRVAYYTGKIEITPIEETLSQSLDEK